MEMYVAEVVGTALLLLMGNAVVANVVLSGTKGHGSGWIVITAGWGLAVYTAVLCVGDISGAHLNPAVTIGLAAAGEFEWAQVPGFVAAQMAGAMLGAAVVYVLHKCHFDVTEDPDAKLAVFCTSPAIRHVPLNLLSEVAGTFVLVFAVLCMTDPEIVLQDGVETPIGLGSIGALRVGMVVFAIGLCLGGLTGYAINPARDLGPRLTHFLWPIPGKRDSDWAYAPIPVVGPILGGIAAAVLAKVML